MPGTRLPTRPMRPTATLRAGSSTRKLSSYPQTNYPQTNIIFSWTESQLKSFLDYHTMHAFTLNQLNDMANTGSHRRAASSPAVHIHQETQQRASTITSNHQPKTLPIPIPTTSASQMKHLTLDEAPYGPTNTPEFGSLALPRQAVLPPTSQDLVARGKELEERFEVMMSSGVGLQMQEGMSPQARDSANAAHRGVGVGSL